MEVEHCNLEVELPGEGIKTQAEAAQIARRLTVILENTIHINGFKFNSKCNSFKDAGECQGICLKEGLKRARLERKARKTGTCLKDKH